MSNELTHYGIKDQKWGLRRFQNPDGSLTPAGRERYGVGKERGTAGGEGQSNESNSSQKRNANKTPGKSSRRVTAMTDDELRSRINRLNMEEQYSNLVTRQKQRNTSVVKSLLGNAAKQLAEQSLSRLVSKVVSKLFDKKDRFAIDDYKDMDVYKMDGDTIKKVADWYTKAGLIERQRSAIADDQKKRAGNKESPPRAEVSASAPNTPTPAAKSTPSGQVPWMYRRSGTDKQKEAEWIERERKKRDKTQYKWIG